MKLLNHFLYGTHSGGLGAIFLADKLCDGVQLDVRCAFVNGANLAVSIKFLNWIILCEADASHQLNALGADPCGDLCREETLIYSVGGKSCWIWENNS